MEIKLMATNAPRAWAGHALIDRDHITLVFHPGCEKRTEVSITPLEFKLNQWGAVSEGGFGIRYRRRTTYLFRRWIDLPLMFGGEVVMQLHTPVNDCDMLVFGYNDFRRALAQVYE